MIPSALDHVQEIASRSGQAAVFLDYDGTLTPIVNRPEDAWLSDSMRQALRELAARMPVAILSGRDLDDVRRVGQAVGEVAWRHRELRKMTGKKVHELQPDIDWDKGRALIWLVETPGLEAGNVFPIYIGDDRTDEGAFRVVKQRGIGILVSEEPRFTAARYSLRDPAEVER